MGDVHGNTYRTFSPSLPVSSGGHREDETTTDEESALLKLTHFVFNQFPDSMGSTPTFQDKPLGAGQEEFVARKKRSPLRPFRWKLQEATVAALKRKPPYTPSSSSSSRPYSKPSTSGFKCPQPQANTQPFKKTSSSRLMPKSRRSSAPSKAVFRK
ncbi:hypothetical protein E2C01_032304 [Portunus trituberculatus]|uniref:Uncharacterized protein n=1 Tax=Portunus trituberculatus TaxID=210409 RepID=A0A5B7F0K9_PORTR|nr:hypothetical protein [Portunus trituberculatus]